ncbi:MBL fold metallo-hydrolase [Nocardioides sediminis]|uniref:MBL fold metallo-hydrolase n=1 Tax=Nocardioides sediminis TaxID=433648 RepID=UPI000D2FA88C|nr:MBL fold metallo-hydrolase [Nocardioides sediminis]
MSIDVTWLGHATVVLDVDGTRLVSDPLLRPHAGVLRRRTPPPDAATWAGTSAVLLSHLHLDHADVRSLRMLPGVPVITAGDNARWVRRKGLLAQVPDGGGWIRVGDGSVEVRLVPAVHRSRPMPHRPNAANGHLVRSSSGVVWIAGDTELFPGLVELPRLAGAAVDVAIVPVGGWGPRLSAGHLGPDEAAEACRAVGARCAVPYHWATLHLPGGRDRPRGWMDAAGPAFEAALEPPCRPVVLGVGESVTVAG